MVFVPVPVTVGLRIAVEVSIIGSSSFLSLSLSRNDVCVCVSKRFDFWMEDCFVRFVCKMRSVTKWHHDASQLHRGVVVHGELWSDGVVQCMM